MQVVIIEWINNKFPIDIGATGGTTITGASGNTGFLNAVITTNRESIPGGGVVIYDNANILGPNYSYNSKTGLFTIKTTGIYVIDWKNSVATDPLTISIQIDLERFLTQTFIDYNETAGYILEFVNNSNGPISILVIGIMGTYCDCNYIQNWFYRNYRSYWFRFICCRIYLLS